MFSCVQLWSGVKNVIPIFDVCFKRHSIVSAEHCGREWGIEFWKNSGLETHVTLNIIYYDSWIQNERLLYNTIKKPWFFCGCLFFLSWSSLLSWRYEILRNFVYAFINDLFECISFSCSSQRYHSQIKSSSSVDRSTFHCTVRFDIVFLIDSHLFWSTQIIYKLKKFNRLNKIECTNMNHSDSVMNIVSTVVQFSQIDYVIIISLLLISLVIGVLIGFSHNGGQTTEDFMFGSFKMKSVPVALSLLARLIQLNFSSFCFYFPANQS